jgi:hypothetical protein
MKKIVFIYSDDQSFEQNSYQKIIDGTNPDETFIITDKKEKFLEVNKWAEAKSVALPSEIDELTDYGDSDIIIILKNFYFLKLNMTDFLESDWEEEIVISVNPVSDTVKKVDQSRTVIKTLDRKNLKMITYPHFYRGKIWKEIVSNADIVSQPETIISYLLENNYKLKLLG